MAGQMYVAGNAYLDNAEFNWWFDPEATQIVLRAAIPHYIIPLDCTNTIPLTKEFIFRSLSIATNDNHSAVSAGLCAFLRFWPAAIYPIYLRHNRIRVSCGPFSRDGRKRFVGRCKHQV